MEIIIAMAVSVVLGSGMTIFAVWLVQRGRTTSESAFMETIRLNRYLCQALRAGDPLVYRDIQQLEHAQRELVTPPTNGVSDMTAEELADGMDAAFDELVSGQPRIS